VVVENLRTPSLQVLVPCYNESEHIEETLLSIHEAGKKWPGAFKILVSDNKSNDNTLELVNILKSSLSEIDVLESNENIGGKRNFSKLMNNATSELIMFIGAHDLINEDFFGNIFLEINKSVNSCIYVGFETRFSSGESLEKLKNLDKTLYNFSDTRFLRMIQAILYLHSSTEFHCVFARQDLDGSILERSKTSSAADHLILYVLLSKKNLKYVQGSRFFRRYEEVVGENNLRFNSAGELASRYTRTNGQSVVKNKDKFIASELFNELRLTINLPERLVYFLILRSKHAQYKIFRSFYRLLRFAYGRLHKILNFRSI
jgi:glycosyltransferase involved in cell wall biosynthesis